LGCDYGQRVVQEEIENKEMNGLKISFASHHRKVSQKYSYSEVNMNSSQFCKQLLQCLSFQPNQNF